MPGITIERPKMTRGMYQSLKKHIMRERERKKQEQEQDKVKEQQRKDQEMRKKKEQEDSLTLGQTKEQIGNLETRLENLKSEKHELFSQLKKVLHQEDENRKRAQIKEHNEMINIQQQYNVAAAVSAHPIFMQQAHVQPRGNKYMNVPVQHTPMPVKRPRSPTPPPPSRPMFPHYANTKYPTTTSYSSPMKRDEPYPTASTKVTSYPSTQVTYAIQSGQPFPQQHMSQHQAPPPHQGPPPQHSSQPSQSQQPPSASHKAPPTQHQVPPPSHQAPPTQHPVPSQQHPGPPQHQVPPPQQLQAPPKQHQAPPTQQLQAPPHHSQGQPPSQAPPHHQAAPPTQHQGSQSQGGKYPAGQSAFQSYTHYAHQQKQMPERMPQGYQVQRVPKPGYIASPHTSSSLSLQQQLEHANQKSGFSEEKFKMQQPIRGVAPIPQQQSAPMLTPSQLPTSQSSGQPPRKGSIVTGYPVRTQASSTNYQPVSTQSTHSPHTSGGPRHAYGGQGSYY